MTFAQKFKTAAMALVAGAGVVATAILIGVIYIVWQGKWTAAVEALRMGFLAHIGIGMAILMGMALVGMLLGATMQRLSGKLGTAEIEVEGE